MIATVSPASSNAEHTCNTLRYADRVKELSHGSSNAVPLVPYPTAKEASDEVSEDEEDVPDEASAMQKPSPQKPKRQSPPKSHRKRSVEAPKRSASPMVAE